MRKWTTGLLLIAAAAVQAAQPSMAILEFQSRGILDRAVLRELWERSHEIAAGIEGYQTLSGEETRKRSFEHNILMPAKCDDGCVQRIAEKMGVDYLVIPSVEKSDKQLKIGYTLVSGRNGERIREGSALSDGRVGPALASALSRALEGGGGASTGSGSRHVWVTAGAAAVGAAAVILLGTLEAEGGSSVARDTLEMGW